MRTCATEDIRSLSYIRQQDILWLPVTSNLIALLSLLSLACFFTNNGVFTKFLIAYKFLYKDKLFTFQR